jgi:hypothetical protein
MNRTNYATQKPENVLKRINELIHSPNGKLAEKEKRFALEQLHIIFTGPKKVKWQKHFEPIMKRHLELCVDLKDHHIAKDGLHQYRNMVHRVIQFIPLFSSLCFYFYIIYFKFYFILIILKI